MAAEFLPYACLHAHIYTVFYYVCLPYTNTLTEFLHICEWFQLSQVKEKSIVWAQPKYYSIYIISIIYYNIF